MSEPTLFLDRSPPIATLELNHGKANEMGRQQLDELSSLVDGLSRDSGTRALITWSQRRSSKGTPIFISGANVTERAGWSRDQVAAHVRYQREVLCRLRRLPLFHVGVVNGVALGWGTEFMITCDYRIATTEASFGLPETGLGILPGAGGSSELSAMIGLPQVLRLGMSGERISAQEALRIGLVQELVDSVEEGMERARALAARVARNSPTAVASFKAAALATVGRPPTERMEIEARAYEHCLDSGEAAIGRAHFKEIRAGAEVPWGARKGFEP